MMELIAQVRGVKSTQNGEYTFHYLVAEDDALRSYQVQLYKPDQAFLESCSKLIGKTARIPFYIRQYQRKSGGEGFSLNYQGDKPPAFVA